MSGQVPVYFMNVTQSIPEHCAEFLKRESAKYVRVIEAAGIKGTL